MERLLSNALRVVDRTFAALWVGTHRERPALLAFLFHHVFEDAHEIARDLVDPYQPVLVSDLRRLIEHFLGHGYRFLAPADLLGELDPTGHYVLLTFDDGYANNLRILPLLRELRVPATIFVSTAHVAEGRAFWWDVIYRERRRRGAAPVTIEREKNALKRRSYSAIEAYVRAEFGAAGRQPIGDTDRPLTPAELRALASEPLVTLGNHTADHAILTVHDDDMVRTQIRAAQESLAALTGAPPSIIAYPNGDYDARVVQLARVEGLRLGVGVAPMKNRLPLSRDAEMEIARYFVRGGTDLLAECRRCRSDLQLRHLRRRPSGYSSTA